MGEKLLKQQIIINPYNLPNEYISDIIGEFDLSYCNVYGIKDELKLFIYKNNLLYLSKSTIQSYKKCFNVFINFINEKFNYTNFDSILDFNINDLDEQYLEYLKNHNITITMETNDLLASMEIIKREIRTLTANFTKRLYEFIVNYEEQEKPKILDRDIWDITNNFPLKLNYEHACKKTFNFKSIKQEKIKKLLKRFIYKKLQVKSVSTCFNYLYLIKKFCTFLDEKYPHIQSLEELNYDIIEEYCVYLINEKELKKNRQSECLTSLETFLNYTMFMKWDGCLKEQIIFDFNTSYIKILNPRYLTDEEINNLNKHLNDMSITLMRMVITLENVGMRISECCFLQQDCLRIDTNGNYFLKYYQYKTTNFNRVPISEEVYLTIQAAIEDAQERGFYDYVFIHRLGHPYSYANFQDEINSVCYKNKILDKDGNILHIQSHMFRGTLATKYLDMGLPVEVIRKLIGQKGIGAIYHYIEGNEAKLVDTFEPIMNARAEMIENIGKKDFVKTMEVIDEEYLPLSNGYCAKKISTGICDKANNCFECAMFKPTSQHYEVYVNQLNRLRKNIEIAEVNGFERQIQVNKRTEQALLKIILTINPNFEKEN